MRRFPEPELLDFSRSVVRALGASEPAAVAVAESLVEADVRGVATHGVVRLPSYRRQVEEGEVQPAAEPAMVHSTDATALVDGRHAFGAVTAAFCVDLAAQLATGHGVGVVAARRCMHFGAAARYALMCARRGLVGIAAANTPAVMAPFGGAEPAVGNNPIAIAAPMADDEPFVLDMAQTVVARGRIKLAEMAGEPIPAGWAIDPDGLPTSDPSRALAGALLPFGGYKGYGLALAVEALTGVLAGAGLSPELANTSMTGNPASREGTQPGSVGSFYLALDPEAFTGRAHYEATLARLREGVTSVRRAPGSNEVLFPGELERRATEDARENGVPLARGTVAMLDELAADLDIKIPEPV